MLLVQSRPIRDPLKIPAPRARGRCVVGVGPHEVVIADVESRGLNLVRNVIVLGRDGRTSWGTCGGPDLFERLEAKRDLATGAQRWWLDAWCERVNAGGPLGQLEVSPSAPNDSYGGIAWRGETSRGVISDPATQPARHRRAWTMQAGKHCHLRLTEPMAWTLDEDGCHTLLLDLEGHELCLQIDEEAAVGTLDGELGAFGVRLGKTHVDPGSFLACAGSGHISGTGMQIEFRVHAAIAEGGPLSVIRACARVEAVGVLDGRPITGRGVLIERTSEPDPLEARFERAGQMVATTIDTLVPNAGVPGGFRALIGRPHGGPFIRGLDTAALVRALVAPIRLIAERGGKAWRSYLMHLCGRACGGDMAPHAALMAVPELVHVGSLIVDDVQDGSDVRRGGPSCHRVHGVALAINAGNAAYFASELAIRQAELDPPTRQWVLDLLFDGFRAGHAGQALDIEGLEARVPEAIASGQYAGLEEEVLTIQWLKSGVPAGAFARMGAVVGAGADAQTEIVEALGEYFERVGTAFQIVDDVLNLRGFEGDLKQRGEDLSTAKVTLPLVYSLARMDPQQAKETWRAISARPTDPVEVEALCARLEQTGGIEAAQDKAVSLVAEAWVDVDRCVAGSQAKMELRALGMFLLKRHY